MSQHPVVELLIRRWGMPSERSSSVEHLLEACDKGATALPLSESEANAPWGAALSRQASLEPTPLVLTHHRNTAYLQTWMAHEAERQIARSIHARMQRTSGSADTLSNNLEARISQLFISRDDPNPDPEQRQMGAARIALTHRFSLITGGPGTGKTTTLARILALLLEQTQEGDRLRISLAAPTGKAAGRMREAVENAVGELAKLLPELHDPLLRAAAGSSTLHRLLGYNPSTGLCRYHSHNPLPLDVLVVDEASMIDVHLWRALLDAVPLHTRLIVLGDPFQLASVAAGRVLADLVEEASGDGALSRCWMHLTKSYRFEKRRDIAALATHIGHENAEGVLDLLRARTNPEAMDGVAWLGDHDTSPLWDKLPTQVLESLRLLAHARTPEDALGALGRICILSAHREHSQGAAGLSAMINRHLSTLGPRPDGLPHNQPIIINQNDPETGLSNGSVGVLMQEGPDARVAWFAGQEAGSAPLRFPLAKLPEHGPAWAMTIHRSQGSEYDHVVIVLPREDSPLATRELIYTAITRAKDKVYLVGPLAAVRAAVLAQSSRTTCLASHLH